jgi:hypothetical protein
MQLMFNPVLSAGSFILDRTESIIAFCHTFSVYL